MSAEPSRRPTPLDEASPTRIAALSECGLRVSFTRAGNGKGPSTPWARLGQLCHEMFEHAARGDLGHGGDDFKSQFDARWTASAARQSDAASKHAIERLWGPIETWPTYSLKRSRVRARAGELARQVHAWDEPIMRIEEELRPPSETLFGKPDLVVRKPAPYRVIDYKTGAVIGDDGAVKVGYRQQLLLYAYLESRMPDGGEPELVVVVPLKGEPIEIAVEWSEVSEVVSTAHELIEEFNAHLDDPEVLAARSAEPCVNCQFAVRCDSFWDRLDTTTPVAAIEGTISEIHNAEKSAVSLAVQVDHGTVEPGLIWLDRFPTDRLPTLEAVKVGNRVRVVGLRILDDDRRTARASGWTRVGVQVEHGDGADAAWK